jgi:signal transduction histidine kinase/DNA-binding response OmpR family regulator
MKNIIILITLPYLLFSLDITDESFSFSSVISVGLFVFVVIAVGYRQLKQASKTNEVLTNKYQRLQTKYDNVKDEHNELLSNLGYKLESTTKEMIKARDKIINEPIKELNKESLNKKFKSLQEADTILTDTTHQIISFLQAKSGKLELNNQTFDINSLFNTLNSFIAQKYKTKDIEIIYNIDNKLGRYIISDFNYINKILINLINNAIKNTESGEVKLIISKFFKTMTEPIIEFKVVDTGIGIKEDKLKSIFMPFKNDRFNNKNTLSLFMSKELVTLMGGELNVMSKHNRGSTFYMNIPLILDTNKDQSYKLESEHKLDGKHIAIIDRNKDIARTIKNMIQHFLYSVSVISQSDLENFETLKQYDMIFVDYKLIDVLFLSNVSKLKKEKDFRVIALSSILDNNPNKIMNSYVKRYILKQSSPLDFLTLFLAEYNSLELDDNENSIDIQIQKKGKKRVNKYAKQIFETENIDKSSLNKFEGANILVVEDNPTNQKIILSILKDTGIKYAFAETIDGALSELDKYYHNFDLILFDINISNHKGHILSQTVRENKKFDNIPIATLLDSRDNRDNLYENGIDAYILSPIKIGTIYTLLLNYLNNKSLIEHRRILDITQGIMQSNNDSAVYIQLLREFKNVYGYSANTFKKFLEEEKYEEAKNLCSNMRGLMNMISAHDMFTLLTQINTLFKEREYKKIDKYIHRYTQELDNLNIEIEIYLRSIDK